MITGEKYTSKYKTYNRSDRHTYEWVYNHHKDCDFEKDLGFSADYFIKEEESIYGRWPCRKTVKDTKFKLLHGTLPNLKREIPYGVLLKMEECKELKLFNAFSAIAPIEAWNKPTVIDPIVFAKIWELPISEDGEYHTSGKTNYYFLAQW